jgi:serine kinase of HPr protein (carbohydrate metabolism regulator)
VTASFARLNIHATGLVLDGVGVAIRGPSGAGKSLLALELLDRYRLAARPGLLVSDDRLELEADGDGLVMHAPPTIAGLIELRGRGIVRRPHVASARLDLVVDLVDDLVRMLEESEFQTDLIGIALARCPVPRRGVADSGHQLLLVAEALEAFESTAGTRPVESTFPLGKGNN